MDIQLIQKVTSALKKMQYNFSDHIKLIQLKGGITNKICLIEFPDNKFGFSINNIKIKGISSETKNN